MKNLLVRRHLGEESPKKRSELVTWAWKTWLFARLRGRLIILAFQMAWQMERTPANEVSLPIKVIHKRKIRLWKVKLNLVKCMLISRHSRSCGQSCPQLETKQSSGEELGTVTVTWCLTLMNSLGVKTIVLEVCTVRKEGGPGIWWMGCRQYDFESTKFGYKSEL